MPFTHSYSSSGVSASAGYNRRGQILSSNSSSSSIDASSLRQAGSSRSATTLDSPTPSEHESTRSRLFSSGRKSPNPFRRFRRLSSSNSLNIATAPPTLDAGQSFDSQQNAYNDTRIPSYQDHRRPSSPAPLEAPHWAPPPLPSSSTKPFFQRPKRTKSSSISILSTGLGLRSRDNLNPPSTTDTRRRHRKSASLSGSDVDFSSTTIDSPRAVTPQPMLRPASPPPSLSESIYSINQDTASRSSAFPPTSAAYQSKQHKQAWFQAQQKTIELENPYNRGAQPSDSDTTKLFPLNVTTTSRPAVKDNGDRGRSSPADSRSPRPVVETFLSEEEMLAAGIHIIRRRDGDVTTVSVSSKDSPGLATARVQEQATVPTMPPRLYGADHPDFLEFIDSPITSKQPSPLLEQLEGPPASSASMQRALSHAHNKSSSGSLSMSSSSSTDYLPPHSANPNDDEASLHNGSTGSLSSGSKHSFSFAKLRRAAPKQNNVAGSSRPSTANSSSNEDVSSNRTFLFPLRSHQPVQQQQQQQAQQQQSTQLSTSSGSAAPGYLTPGPGSSASPFLNKHSATVGRASGSNGAGYTAKNGLAQVFNGSGSSAATVGPSSSASNPYHVSSSNGVPPPKPPKPKPSLLAAFPRSSNNSISGSISAPTSAQFDPRYDSERKSNSRDMLRPPSSAGVHGNGVYGNISHSRSQEAVAEARLEAEALRASAGTPMPPPRRLNASRGAYGGSAGGSSAYSAYSSTAMGRSTSGGGGGGGVVGALGHVGQIGAAMGRKGWDFMKTLQSSNNAVASGRGGAYAPSYPNGAGSMYSSSAAAAENEPTRQWLMLLDGPDPGRNTPGGIFGAPLKDAVLRSRLSSIAGEAFTNDDHLGVPDLGKDFSANFLESPRVTPRASVAGNAAGEPLSREEARHLFLPRIFVRCIESLEKWGPSEEGIYRISGRSSHTSKLRAHFSDPRNDLRLDEINPANLDINSVCSLLKSYLRELPETLIPMAQSKALDQAVARLFADTEASTTEAGGSGGKVTDARAAQIPADKVAEEFSPLMRQLSVYNWYLLRELTHHLGLLAQPDVVARTKMPISNLTLVLAPTVSISLPLLQVLVRHREVVFAGPAPSEDVAAAAVAAITSPTMVSSPTTSQQSKRNEPPPKPAKPEKLSSPTSRLPVMVRKRASSMGLGALLSSPTRQTAAAEKQAKYQHRKTPSTTPSLQLPAYIGSSELASPVSPMRTQQQPPSPSVADEPYERPSTSLGHFADSPSKPTSSASNHRRFGSRDAALRFNALALDDSDRTSPSKSKGRGVGGEETPIARYYARIREEAERALDAEQEGERDGAKTPIAPIPASATGGEMHRYWAGKTSSSSNAGLLSPNLGEAGRSGRTSALDRPRPPTSSSASFFAGRSRRQDSVNGLAAFKPSHASTAGGGSGSGIPRLVRSESQSQLQGGGSTKPLKIVKRTTPASESNVNSNGGDSERTPRLGYREEKVEDDVQSQIRRYLEGGPGKV